MLVQNSRVQYYLDSLDFYLVFSYYFFQSPLVCIGERSISTFLKMCDEDSISFATDFVFFYFTTVTSNCWFS